MGQRGIGMSDSRRRGNLLLTAVFMSVFLFFLSVALVATNRQDLSLAIFVDNHMRSQMAAQAGANLALQTMKVNSSWQNSLEGSGLTQTMQSGAQFTVNVSAYTGTDATLHLYQIHSHGKAGVVTADFDVITEEYAIADSVATSNAKPNVFLVANRAVDAIGTAPTQLCYLGQDFAWHYATSLSPATVRVTTFSGGGGALFYNKAGTHTPPTVVDWNHTGSQYAAPFLDQPANAPLPVSSGFQTGLNEDYILPVRNVLQDTVAKDPNVDLAHSVNATRDGVDVATNPMPAIKYQYFPLKPPNNKVNVSEYQGDAYDWYAIDGSKSAAEGDNVYVHATHYIYIGEHWQNHPTQVLMSLENSGGVYDRPYAGSAPCVLCYNRTSNSWTRVMDPITFSGPPSTGYQAQAYKGLQPDKSTLTVASKTCYCYNTVNANGSRYMQQCTSRGLQQFSSENVSNPVIVGYSSQPHALLSAATSSAVGINPATTPYYLSGMAIPSSNIAPEVPALTAELFDGNGNWLQWPVNHDRNVVVTPSTNQYCYSVAGSDLWCMGSLTAKTVAPVTANPQAGVPAALEAEPTSNYAFFHYDGKAWQVLPQGVHATLFSTNTNASGVPFQDAATNTTYIAQPLTAVLAVVGFTMPGGLLHRYQPVAIQHY